MPDYDGRGNPDAEAGSWVLWIPRAALAPFYVASEYVLRRPLGALVGHAERDRWSDSLAHLFTFGEGGHSRIVPIARFDLGLAPSVGLDYTRDAVLAADNALVLRFSAWGLRSIDAAVADRYAIDGADRVRAELSVHRSEDQLFLGLGPDATTDTRSRYGLARFAAGAAYRRDAGALRLDAASGLGRVMFLDGACCGDPSLDTRIAHREVMAPPGFRDDYTAVYGRVAAAIDSRGPDAGASAGSGGYLHGHAGPSLDARGGRSWLAWGGALGGAIDVTGHRRVISAQVAADFVDPVTGDAVPFTELAALGGDRMAGFVTGWMTGRSTAVAQLGYTWPLWLGLNARTGLAVGNAFDAHLAGLSASKLRLSGDVALMSSTRPDRGFEVVLGLGTETFEQGAAITSVRVMLGSKRGL